MTLLKDIQNFVIYNLEFSTVLLDITNEFKKEKHEYN